MKEKLENHPNYDEIRKKEEKIIKIFLFLLIGLLVLEGSLQTITNIKNSIEKSHLSKKYDSSKYIILTLGESTTESNGHSWPEQLQTKLDNLSLKKKVQIINLAEGGVNSAFIMANVNEYIETYKPDMIITMMGWNDLDQPYIFNTKSENIFISLFENLKTTKLIKLIINYFYKPNITNIDPNHYLTKFEPYSNISSNKSNFNSQKNKLEIYPNDEFTLNLLGDISFNINLNTSIYYYSKVLTVNPKHCMAWISLSDRLIEVGLINDGRNILEQMLRNYFFFGKCEEEKNRIYFNLLQLYKKTNEKKKINILTKKINMKEESKAIEYHHKRIYNISIKENITLVIMQYPTMNVEMLKSFFNKTEQDNIIFIENKNNFNKAFKTKSYEDLFIDNFARGKEYNFGHATALGDELIANNVVKNIIYILNSTENNNSK